MNRIVMGCRWKGNAWKGNRLLRILTRMDDRRTIVVCKRIGNLLISNLLGMGWRVAVGLRHGMGRTVGMW